MIWCVEDDAGIRDIETYTLASMGYEARGFEDGKSLFAALHEATPRLIILDVMLPGMDGIQILQNLRADGRTRDIPVIMATAKGSEYDRIRGLDLGADDCLVKPFSMMEMVSRVRAVLRRAEKNTNPDILTAAGLTLDPGEHTVSLQGERIPLTYKEFELLRLFMSHPGRAFTREDLLHSVWQSDYLGETRTVDMHIRTLRQKLQDWGRHIETVRNVGYRLEV